jgi:hypothetical protein
MNTNGMSTIEVGGLRVSFKRTCRVPEGKVNSLPAGLGDFPVFRVSDYKSGCPEGWRPDGFFFPMYRQEAMWMNFGRTGNPTALIVGAGNINAISGRPFDPSKDKLLGADREQIQAGSINVALKEQQNYLVVPPQPWIDGWKGADGKVYQFVAAEMGSQQTVEYHITGEETVGGIQLVVYRPKDGQHLIPASRPHEFLESGSFGGGYGGGFRHYLGGGAMRGGDSFTMGLDLGAKCLSAAPSVRSMGLGRGGEIEQKIYPDPYGRNVWNEAPDAVEIVYLVSSEDFRQITGREAPPTPVTYAKYQELGLPWFGLHDGKLGDTQGSTAFASMSSVGDGKGPLTDKLKPYQPKQ